jgi:hypothetical protein
MFANPKTIVFNYFMRAAEAAAPSLAVDQRRGLSSSGTA